MEQCQRCARHDEEWRAKAERDCLTVAVVATNAMLPPHGWRIRKGAVVRSSSVIAVAARAVRGLAPLVVCAELERMGVPDPKQAIFDELGGPVGVWEPGPLTPGGVQSAVVRGGAAERADLRTVMFIRHRRSDHRHIYYVTFDGTHPAFGNRTLSFR